MTDIAIGLVTHVRSRFDADGAATTQARELTAALQRDGATTALLVSDRDDYDPETYPLTRTPLLRSAVYQADLEYRWRRYLAAAGAPARSAFVDRGLMVGMAARRCLAANSTEAARRLINIDLSHLRVWEWAAETESRWTLVLEDDARTGDIESAANRIRAIVTRVDDSPVQFINLSQSIAHGELGIQGIVGDPDPAGLAPTRRPVTNTVCANLYRTSFVRGVAGRIRERGLIPVAPIDWRLNEVVMEMVGQGRLDAASCMWSIPGVFVQGSMHHGSN